MAERHRSNSSSTSSDSGTPTKSATDFSRVFAIAKIGGVDILGSLAVYGEYGDHSRFMLAAGGFNPHFTDVPDAIRSMDDRLGAAFKISAFEVTLTGYFAITPGTIQFGVNLSAKAEAWPRGARG